MPNLIVSAVSTFDNKGLKKGAKEISAFDKSTQKLGKTFAKVFGTLAVASFAKNAVNAFIESEKAAAKLRTTVQNLGLEFEQPGIDKYLRGLSLQFGIIDENLIPGFQRLLIVTKDVSKAQEIFETALNVSAGTGKDLNAVTTSLSKAYMGDNVALGRLGVGLSKAQLKSSSFLDVQRTLNANFAGQAQAAVQGYAGSMAKLTVAVDESKEAIGKGLLDAIAALSGSNDIDTFTVKMVNAAEKIGSAFATVADFISLLDPRATFKMGGTFLRKKDFAKGNFQYGAGNPRADLLVTKKVVKARNDEFKIITASNKAKTAVDALRDKFDIERIGLAAALNAATDEETKLRIKSQIAILDNNEALAKKLLAELEAAEAAKKLAAAANDVAAVFARLAIFDPLSGLKATAADILATIGLGKLASSMGQGGGTMSGTRLPPATTAYDPLSSVQATSADLAATGFRYDPLSGMRVTQQDIKITVDTSQTGDRFAQLIAESIQVAERSGFSTSANGSLP